LGFSDGIGGGIPSVDTVDRVDPNDPVDRLHVILLLMTFLLDEFTEGDRSGDCAEAIGSELVMGVHVNDLLPLLWILRSEEEAAEDFNLLVLIRLNDWRDGIGRKDLAFKLRMIRVLERNKQKRKFYCRIGNYNRQLQQVNWTYVITKL